MDIKKIAQFVYPRVNSTSPAVNATPQEQTPAKLQQKPQSDNEAVKVSADLSNKADSQSKISQLKSQVNSGTYAPSSREVAGAVLRDLFA